MSQKIEVIMRKEMTEIEYKEMIPSARKKGWHIQGYQLGFYSEGLKKKVK